MSMADVVASGPEFDAAAQLVDAWLERQLAENPAVAALDRGEPGEHRWYLRLLGEEKEVFAVWWTLRQRTLHYETYVMPDPPENRGEVFELLLRRNARIFGAAFNIGDEDAVYLAGQVPLAQLDEGELDRILGTLWEWVERTFRPAMRLGFASRFSG
jgi:hypothetical protein